MRAKFSGSCCCSHSSLLTVYPVSGTMPNCSNHAFFPPNLWISSAFCSAVSVSFHSFAGRITCIASSSTTSPCCWPLTPIAAT